MNNLTVTEFSSEVLWNITTEYDSKSVNMADDTINRFGFNPGPLLAVEMIISMICLLITCIVYLKIPDFRNVPGRIVVCICSCMFLTYLFLIMDFMVRKKFAKTITCLSVAFLIHFFFTSVFTWTNVMSYDIWRTLSSVTPDFQTNSRQRKRFMRYSLYAWLTSILATAPAFIIDPIDSVPYKYKPKFGVKRCWLSGTTAFLIYFNLPIGITLVTNLIFFIRTAFVLKKLKKQTEMLKNNKTENRLRLHVKLVIVMGFVWFSEYLPWMTGVFQLYLIAGIITCLYGVFLFVLFVCKRRVWNLIKSNFNCCSKPSSAGRLFGKASNASSSSNTNWYTSTVATSTIDLSNYDLQSRSSNDGDNKAVSSN